VPPQRVAILQRRLEYKENLFASCPPLRQGGILGSIELHGRGANGLYTLFPDKWPESVVGLGCVKTAQPGSKGEILTVSRYFPLYSQDRTWLEAAVLSVSCHNRT
jgi:hypothetical protein